MRRYPGDRGVAILCAVPFTRLFVALTLLLTAVLFSLAGLLNAVFAKTFDDISLIPTFVLTPLTYLGGCSTR